MAAYILRRILYLIPTLAIISVLSFAAIIAPPGDFIESYLTSLELRGGVVNEQVIQNLKHLYGLDRPVYEQYWAWIRNIVTRFDFGMSFAWNRPVSKIILERIPLTIALSLGTIIFQLTVAVPIAIFSAVKQHTLPDYVFTVFAFIGKATPNFMLALVLMFVLFTYLDISMGGLFSEAYKSAPWSFAKFLDLLQHMIVPIIVIGTAGTADTVRVLRATMLDELGKDYVRTARAKGLHEMQLVLKHPFRVAVNPLISTVGWLLPSIISGEIITSIVLNLPTTGPMMYNALLAQDMYLAGSFLLVLSILTVLGTLISDLLLAAVDPRIRYN